MSCTSPGKEFYSDLDIVGGDIPSDEPVRVKCISMVESVKEPFPDVVSRYIITGKIE